MAGAGATRECGPWAAKDIAAGRMTPALIMAATVWAIASLLYGYDTGIISGRSCRSPTTSTSPTDGSRSSPPASCSARSSAH